MAEHEPDRPADERIAFRIGINLGDVIIEEDDIYGDGVNVAAALEALAEPGGICVSRTVYNQVKGKVDFSFAPTGEHRVKNISEPVTVYGAVLAAPRWRPARFLRLRRRGMIGAAAAAALAIVAGSGALERLSAPRATRSGRCPVGTAQAAGPSRRSRCCRSPT